MVNSTAFAEVIESSLSGWTSQSWQWNKFPTFGSLVTIETQHRTLFGLVCQTQTGSMDPTRYPFPYKKTEQELLAEQPQIFEFLKTTFTSMTVGYIEHSHIVHLLAPEPPHIHAFVQEASKKLASQFFASEQFLHLIFGATAQQINLDELLLANLKYQKSLEILTEDRLKKYLGTYALLIGNDYRRLKFFAQRTQYSIHT